MDNNNNNRPSLGVDTIVKVVAFALLLLIGGVLLSTLTPVIFPPQASAESRSVDNLFRVLLVLGGIVFFLIQGLLVISVIAFRARPGDHSDGPASHGNMTLEIVWTIIPSLVVVFLAILSFNVWNQNTAAKDDENRVNGESITINVTGARYAWTHSYETNVSNPNAEGESVVLNSGPILHTYIGQNVYLTLQTQDVIHSYWIPAMRVKQDLLPGDPAEGGRPTYLRFTPVRIEDEQYPAEYPIVCAELCGDGHGRMRGTVVVYESEEQYLELFYEPEVDRVLNPPADPVLRGEGIIGNYACQGCHVLDQLGWAGLTGPSLNNVAATAGERRGGYTAEEYLAESVWHSTAYLVPGYQGLMPVFAPADVVPNGTGQISAEELYMIVSYLCTIPSPEESDCDTENLTTSVPGAIDSIFGVTVDVSLGAGNADASGVDLSILDTIYGQDGDGDAGAEATAEVTSEPDSEATEEAEATQEAGE